jgi:hypothetical protein
MYICFSVFHLVLVLFSEDVARRIRIHSYGKSFDAFAAHLLPEEAERLKRLETIKFVMNKLTYVKIYLLIYIYTHTHTHTHFFL